MGIKRRHVGERAERRRRDDRARLGRGVEKRGAEGSGVRRFWVVRAAPVQSLRVEADVLHGEVPRQDVLAPVAKQRHHLRPVVGRYLILVQQLVHNLVLVRRRLGQFLHRGAAWLNGLELAT